jgi:hypothetical protein
VYKTEGVDAGSPVTYATTGDDISNSELTIKIQTNVAGAYDFTF